MDILIVLTRTIIFYVFILICFRLMGKREIGELSISDLTISTLIAQLVAISIENEDESMLLTILPISLLVLLEITSSILQLKHNNVRTLLDGKPSVIINKRRINIKEMIKQRFSINDLLLCLRENGISNIRDVDYAILETNGKLSIFKHKIKSPYPLPIIIDGFIDKDTLKNINKSKKWLYYNLDKENLNVKDILYAFYKNKKLYIIKK